ncbi:hypothetical protein ABW19_dt0206774 [Dactylella cylindrospora]|nr:hypothetical protein ABW19_dt0206774 [Dactylella cylindrospora]
MARGKELREAQGKEQGVRAFDALPPLSPEDMGLTFAHLPEDGKLQQYPDAAKSLMKTFELEHVIENPEAESFLGFRWESGGENTNDVQISILASSQENSLMVFGDKFPKNDQLYNLLYSAWSAVSGPEWTADERSVLRYVSFMRIQDQNILNTLEVIFSKSNAQSLQYLELSRPDEFRSIRWHIEVWDALMGLEVSVALQEMLGRWPNTLEGRVISTVRLFLGDLGEHRTASILFLLTEPASDSTPPSELGDLRLDDDPPSAFSAIMPANCLDIYLKTPALIIERLKIPLTVHPGAEKLKGTTWDYGGNRNSEETPSYSHYRVTFTFDSSNKQHIVLMVAVSAQDKHMAVTVRNSSGLWRSGEKVGKLLRSVWCYTEGAKDLTDITFLGITKEFAADLKSIVESMKAEGGHGVGEPVIIDAIDNPSIARTLFANTRRRAKWEQGIIREIIESYPMSPAKTRLSTLEIGAYESLDTKLTVLFRLDRDFGDGLNGVFANSLRDASSSQILLRAADQRAHQEILSEISNFYKKIDGEAEFEAAITRSDVTEFPMKEVFDFVYKDNSRIRGDALVPSFHVLAGLVSITKSYVPIEARSGNNIVHTSASASDRHLSLMDYQGDMTASLLSHALSAAWSQAASLYTEVPGVFAGIRLYSIFAVSRNTKMIIESISENKPIKNGKRLNFILKQPSDLHQLREWYAILGTPEVSGMMHMLLQKGSKNQHPVSGISIVWTEEENPSARKPQIIIYFGSEGKQLPIGAPLYYIQSLPEFARYLIYGEQIRAERAALLDFPREDVKVNRIMDKYNYYTRGKAGRCPQATIDLLKVVDTGIPSTEIKDPEPGSFVPIGIRVPSSAGQEARDYQLTISGRGNQIILEDVGAIELLPFPDRYPELSRVLYGSWELYSGPAAEGTVSSTGHSRPSQAQNFLEPLETITIMKLCASSKYILTRLLQRAQLESDSTVAHIPESAGGGRVIHFRVQGSEITPTSNFRRLLPYQDIERATIYGIPEIGAIYKLLLDHHHRLYNRAVSCISIVSRPNREFEIVVRIRRGRNSAISETFEF